MTFFRSLPLPRTLLGQFRLALTALVLLIVAGGLTAIYSLRTSSNTSRDLAEERLARLQDAQGLVQRTLLIERNAYRMLTAESREGLRDSYAEIITQLELLDALVERLGQADGDVSVLDLHQNSQLFRNTTHIVARLRNEILQTAAVPAGPEAPPSPSRRPGARQTLLRHYHGELVAQVIGMTSAAAVLSDHFSEEYREKVWQLSATSRQNQHLVFSLLLGSLLLAWLVSKIFLGIHVVDRLRKVSQYLRVGETEELSPVIPVQGNDEIGEMARSVEQFLKDRRHLVETRNALRESEELLRTMTNSVQSGVMLIDHHDRIQFVNPAAVKLFGYAEEELIGHQLHEILVPEPLRQQAREGLARYAATGEGAVFAKPLERMTRRKDGSEVCLEIAVGRVRRDEQWWAVGAVADISAHKAREEVLAQLAGTDQLTGVANRRNFLQVAEHELKRCRREKLSLYFLMFDLDHFKQINDTHGHATGDAVLRAFASTCTANLRDSDLFGRLGGEEFAAVMTGLSPENALATAERIRTAFVGLTVTGEGQALRIDTSVSIGMVQVDPAEESVESGLRLADEALYLAKEQGRNRVVVGREPRMAALEEEVAKPASRLPGEGGGA